MDLVLDLKLLLLLFVANGAPVVAKDVLKHRFQAPLDGGSKLIDGEPVLGHSKTIRGIVCSLLATTIVAPLLGLPWVIGFVVSGAAMLGDVLSSFIKRRLKLSASSQAVGIDQLPESLLPLLACVPLLALSLADIAIVVCAFVICEIVFSKVLFKLHIRDRPY